eukprot:g24484.t1
MSSSICEDKIKRKEKGREGHKRKKARCLASLCSRPFTYSTFRTQESKKEEESHEEEAAPASPASVSSSDLIGLSKKAPVANFSDLAQDLQPPAEARLMCRFVLHPRLIIGYETSFVTG